MTRSPVSRESWRASAREELRGKIVMHTSGALSASVLQSVQRLRGGHRLDASVAIVQRRGGSPARRQSVCHRRRPGGGSLARQIARALGGLPVQIDGRSKPLYHAAAAFAAGHVLAIEEASMQLLMLAGMKRAEAVRALLQLDASGARKF